MSGSKAFDKIAWSITALALIVTVLFMNGSALGLAAMPRVMGYENRLFDNTKVHTIEIVMDNWDEFIRNATSEQYYSTTLIIDGEAYKNVAIRGKGNTSLTSVATMNSQRYSFKVEFDYYDNSMTYHGLDKLCLNNMFQDTTMMKDYLAYTLMNEFDAAAPLCSFVYITVNGEDWGLYLAVEGVEDSFMLRNYNSDQGELYKPDGMNFAGGPDNGDNGSSGGDEDAQTPPKNGGEGSSGGGENTTDPTRGDTQTPPENGSEGSEGGGEDTTDPTQGDSQTPPKNGGDGSSGGGEDNPGGGPGGGFGFGGSAVNLQYLGDSIDSYSAIWNNAKTDINEEDQLRLIASLKQLSTYENLETVVDIERVIRYFVVHNFVCNGDSYTGNIIHNYYLYEEDGVMSMIPWDYNLAFGTFGGDTQGIINEPIDAPVSGGTGADRPMWYWILSDEAYTELYHQYFAEFLDTVKIGSIIDNAYQLIKDYVKKDPSAFFSYEEFETGVESLRAFCTLRSVSIAKQLETGETTKEMGYVDTSDLQLSLMGTMGGGPGGDEPGGGGSSGGDEPGTEEESSQNQSSGGGESAEGGEPPTTEPGETTPSQPAKGGSEGSGEGETTPSQPTEGGSEGSGEGETNPSQPAEGFESGETTPSQPAESNRPGGGFDPDRNNQPGSSSENNRDLLIASVMVLLFGLIIAKFYRR